MTAPAESSGAPTGAPEVPAAEPAPMFGTLADVFGPPVHVYTRGQAVADGVLVDVSTVAPSVVAQHFGAMVRDGIPAPVVFTAGLWAIVARAVENRKVYNDVNGVVHDILWMSRGALATAAREAARSGYGERADFLVIVKGAGRRSVYKVSVHVGPGDDGRPVVTYLLPDED